MSARDFKIILCYKNNEDGSPIFYNEKTAPTESLNPDTKKPYKAGDRVCTMLNVDTYQSIMAHFPKQITKIKEAANEHEFTFHQAETIKEITIPPAVKIPKTIDDQIKEINIKPKKTEVNIINKDEFDTSIYTCKKYKESTFTKEQLLAFIKDKNVSVSIKKYAQKDLGKLQSV